jgi:glycosyltransferase involved in cell wall biosynthesis
MNPGPGHNPRVSLCVPTYNGAHFFRECLHSLQAQTLTDFEVIIVDDESTDATLDIAREFARHDPRFQIHPNPKRLGLVGNWNRSLELARGEWIKFVFQDDTIEPRCLERLVGQCEQFKCAFGFCQRHLLYEANTSVATRRPFDLHQQEIAERYGTEDSFIAATTFARLALQRPGWNLIGEPTVVLFNRSVIKDFGWFVPAMIQLCDLEYWLRLGSNVGVVHVAERLATFRVHDQSTTSRNQSKRDYRARLIDPLVMDYLVLHEEHYRKLRSELYRSSGRLVNWWRLLWSAQQAWSATRAVPVNLEILAEWNSVTATYPRLKNFARLGRWLTQIRGAVNLLGLERFVPKKSLP